MTTTKTRQPAAAQTTAKRVRSHGCWWDLRYSAHSK
jgi:hypothetical protein